MAKRKLQNSPQFNRNHILLTVATFTVGGLITACVSMAYAFVVYPNVHRTRPAVAGAMDEQWVAPIRNVAAASLPAVSAPAGLLLDVETGAILWERAATDVRPLASLTKLVTASAYLETAPNLAARYTIPADFHTHGIANVVEPGTGVSKLDVQPGERITFRDLLAASLIGSANNAALALARSAGLDAAQLQHYGRTHGARTLQIAEASGLEPKNLGSALDVAVLAHVAFSLEPLRTFAGLPSYHITTSAGRGFTIRSTDALIGKDGYTIVAGKTGFLEDAGYNLVVQARQDDHDVLLVLLGSPTSDDRFADADAMLRWAFGAYSWQVVRGNSMLPL